MTSLHRHLPPQKYAMRGSKEEDENTLQLVRAFFNGDDSFAINNRRDEEPEDNYKNRSWEVRTRCEAAHAAAQRRSHRPTPLNNPWHPQ